MEPQSRRRVFRPQFRPLLIKKSRRVTAQNARVRNICLSRFSAPGAVHRPLRYNGGVTFNSTPDQAGTLIKTLQAALAARAGSFDPRHESAFRLFNGFREGCPALVADLYGRTLVLHSYADPPAPASAQTEQAADFYEANLPWLRAVLTKARYADTDDARKGIIIRGAALDRFVLENEVWYAVDLRLNQDAGLYLDTRHLREWLKTQMAGKTVLNTFAYTGSLGVAAQAGGAARVVQLDLSRAFLNVAKDSYARNGFAVNRADFLAGDFWPQISRLKQSRQQFDCVIVDPPLFSRTRYGTVDLAAGSARILNKVRPLVADGGVLIAINNALFVSGADYLAALQALCADGYLSLETLIPVPLDFLGPPDSAAPALPADPAPFNHPTKIAVLRVRRK